MRLAMYAISTALLAIPGASQERTSQDTGALTIVIREGGNAINRISDNATARLVVEVQDSGGQPLAGVEVTFAAPRIGPRLVFTNGADSMSTTTDADGRAIAGDLRPIDVGPFEILISAHYQDRRATALISQSNADADSTASDLSQGAFKIQILAGDDGVNIIDKKTAVRPVVRVLDKNNLPVAAVPVAFVLLATKGPRLKLPGREGSVEVVTDANGVAKAPSMQPQGKGSFQLEIRMTVEGTTYSRSIAQTNYPNILAAQKAGKVPGSSAPAEDVPSATTSTTEAASSTASTTSAASAGPAEAGGLSAGQIGAVAASGLLAAGGIAKAAGLLDQGNGAADCTAEVNALTSPLNSAISCVDSAVQDPLSQCMSVVQNLMDTLGRACSCLGGFGGAPSDFVSTWQDLLAGYRQLGYNTTAASACR